MTLLRPLKLAVAGLALIVLSACSTLTSDPGELRARTELVCAGWTGTYKTLDALDMGGRLSKVQVSQVNAVRPMFKEACREDAEPMSAITISLLEDQLLQLAIMQQESER